MPESVTESFCERCGTRYTFSASDRLDPLRKTRGLAAGLKHYLTSTDSLSDAVSDALHAETESLSDRQMEAYHRVFSFCIECRQYACREKCWNDRVGRCLTCAPVVVPTEGAESWPGHDLLQPILSDPMTDEDGTARAAAAAARAELSAQAWPDADTAAAAERPAAAPQAQPVLGDDVAVEPDAGPLGEPAVAGEAGAAEEAELRVDLETYEPAAGAAPQEAVEPEPVIAAGVEPEPELVDARSTLDWADAHSADAAEPVETATEASVTDVAVEAAAEGALADPVVAEEAEPAEPAFPELPPERIAALVETPEAAARRAQLETLGLPDPGRHAAAAEPSTVLPYRPLRTPELTARSPLWDASTRRVAAAGTAVIGVQECSHCGLSLSANARFCRRCGMRQARSA
ncbi:MAG: zinc ribbon domain-containing protein [Candidatus Limnocylindria bacterium]